MDMAHEVSERLRTTRSITGQRPTVLGKPPLEALRCAGIGDEFAFTAMPPDEQPHLIAQNVEELPAQYDGA
jgi:hypothetical protein